MAGKAADSRSITIEFTEQQMELVNKLANKSGKSVSESVAQAVEDFIQKEGSHYTG